MKEISSIKSETDKQGRQVVEIELNYPAPWYSLSVAALSAIIVAEIGFIFLILFFRVGGTIRQGQLGKGMKIEVREEREKRPGQGDLVVLDYKISGTVPEGEKYSIRVILPDGQKMNQGDIDRNKTVQDKGFSGRILVDPPYQVGKHVVLLQDYRTGGTVCQTEVDIRDPPPWKDDRKNE